MYETLGTIRPYLDRAQVIQMNNHRAQYNNIMTAIESGADEFLFGGDVAISALLGRPLSIGLYNFELYGENIYMRARDIADAIVDLPHKFIDEKTTELQTNIKHKELTLYVNTLQLAKFYNIEQYHNKSVMQLMGPEIITVDGYFGGKIRVLPVDVLIIDMYRKIYSLVHISSLAANLEYCAGLYKYSLGARDSVLSGLIDESGSPKSKKEKSQDFGGRTKRGGDGGASGSGDSSCIINIDTIDDIEEGRGEVREIEYNTNDSYYGGYYGGYLGGFEIPNKQKFNEIIYSKMKAVIIGDYAIDLYTHGKVNFNRRLQYLSVQSPGEILTWLESTMEEVIGGNILFKNVFGYRSYDIDIPNDFQLIKYTFHYGDDKISLFDVYNSPTYELIPFMEIRGRNVAILPVVIRFRYIEIWLLKMLFRYSSAVQPQMIKKIYSDIDLLQELFTGANLSEMFSSDPDFYYGVNVSERIAKKKLIKSMEYIPSYFPAKK